MDKVEQLKELISYYGGTQVSFANKIGRKQGHISTWLQRKAFDVDLVAKCCTEISAEWLLRCEGPMLKEKQNEKSNEEREKEIKIRELEIKNMELEHHIQLLQENITDLRRSNEYLMGKNNIAIDA